MIASLTINGKPTILTHEYSVAFYYSDKGMEPTLYFQGKRVSSSWRLEMIAEVAEDKDKNANTA